MSDRPDQPTDVYDEQLRRLSPEQHISLQVFDAVRTHWEREFGAVVPAAHAIHPVPNDRWGEFLYHRAQRNAVAYIANAPSSLEREPGFDGDPFEELTLEIIQQRLGMFAEVEPRRRRTYDPTVVLPRATAEEIDAFAAHIHSIWRYRTGDYYWPVPDIPKKGDPMGYIVEFPQDLYHFSEQGEFKDFQRFVSYQPEIGPQLRLRFYVHFRQGMLTRLWMELPNGTLFEPGVPVPEFVTTTLNNGQRRPPRPGDLEAFLELVNTRQPIFASSRGRSPHWAPRNRRLMLQRLASTQERMNARAVQVVHFRRFRGESICQVGYRQQFRYSKTQAHSQHPLWAPNTPDRPGGTVTRLMPESVREYALEDLERLLALEV